MARENSYRDKIVVHADFGKTHFRVSSEKISGSKKNMVTENRQNSPTILFEKNLFVLKPEKFIPPVEIGSQMGQLVKYPNFRNGNPFLRALQRHWKNNKKTK